MSKIVERSVAVHHPDTGYAHWFHKGDELPKWAEEIVTNPTVFVPIGTSRKEVETRDQEVESMLHETSTTTDYSKMNKAHLEALLEERGLATGGNKAELVERLKASDGATG